MSVFQQQSLYSLVLVFVLDYRAVNRILQGFKPNIIQLILLFKRYLKKKKDAAMMLEIIISVTY